MVHHLRFHSMLVSVYIKHGKVLHSPSCFVVTKMWFAFLSKDLGEVNGMKRRFWCSESAGQNPVVDLGFRATRWLVDRDV